MILIDYFFKSNFDLDCKPFLQLYDKRPCHEVCSSGTYLPYLNGNYAPNDAIYLKATYLIGEEITWFNTERNEPSLFYFETRR
jgi:hypothetical protein